MKGIGALALILPVLLTGCQSQITARHEGVTPGAGNAIAANTALQMVDPWPWGVGRTDFAVPADLDQYVEGTGPGPGDNRAVLGGDAQGVAMK